MLQRHLLPNGNTTRHAHLEDQLRFRVRLDPYRPYNDCIWHRSEESTIAKLSPLDHIFPNIQCGWKLLFYDINIKDNSGSSLFAEKLKTVSDVVARGRTWNRSSGHRIFGLDKQYSNNLNLRVEFQSSATSTLGLLFTGIKQNTDNLNLVFTDHHLFPKLRGKWLEFLGGKRFGSGEDFENVETTWINLLALEARE
ncbi:hypothetical protein TNCV_2169761 [Trichonephila clavipes]|nr:hypothetical protein TNCV_2169761 [Trichonephila clavipes]